MSKTDYVKDMLEDQPWSQDMGQVQYWEAKKKKAKKKVLKKLK